MKDQLFNQSPADQLYEELTYDSLNDLHCSIFFLVQTWYSVTKDICKLFSNLFIFKNI